MSQPQHDHTGIPSPNRLDKIEGLLREVRDAVIGNEAIGFPGLVKRVETLEKAKDEQTKTLWKWGGAFTGAGLALTFIKDWFSAKH